MAITLHGTRASNTDVLTADSSLALKLLHVQDEKGTTTHGGSASANSGSGGGGGANSASGGSGGSGIVVVRYKFQN